VMVVVVAAARHFMLRSPQRKAKTRASVITC